MLREDSYPLGYAATKTKLNNPGRVYKGGGQRSNPLPPLPPPSSLNSSPLIRTLVGSEPLVAPAPQPFTTPLGLQDTGTGRSLTAMVKFTFYRRTVFIPRNYRSFVPTRSPLTYKRPGHRIRKWLL